MRHAPLPKHVAKPKQRWLLVALSLMIALCAQSLAFAAPTLPPDAEYSRPRLTPESQGFGLPGFAWTNVVPNALASYFTYVPYSNADAVALGFPASCGNPSTLLPADLASTDDCYTITAKKFPQQLAIPSIFGGGPGLLDANGAPLGAATVVYGYGSGGTGWIPPNQVATPQAVTGNAPAPFATPPPNGFTTAGIWHFPAPTIKGTQGRPVRIQWLNELPNEEPPGFDPTVDCSDTAPDCFPFNRLVTHVHGAHVGPASDGLAHASFNPNFTNLGTKFNQSVLPPAEGPIGTYVYPMDQEAGTIWYHDHAVGTTHLNTNMGLAGFFPITDDQEKCLQGIITPLCPAPAKVLPSGNFELGFALQDRVFYTDGTWAMPDAPVIDANFPTCDPTDAGTRMATCSPLFMYVSHAADPASLTPAGIHKVPYDETTLDLTIPQNADAPLLATSATLEFFGNMPVVNGVVYGKYDVEPRVYRMRFIGGTDSRTWVLQLQNRTDNTVIPFWQIGSEQGFLNAPAPRTEMLLLPGERLDVLVDFNNIPAGTKIVLNNLGSDAPYQGEPLNLLARSVDIPEIMEFNTVALDPTVPDTAVAPSAIGAGILRPAPIAPLTATANLPIRKVALEEIVDEYGRIMPTIDRRGYDLPGMPATEIIHLFDVEQWDIINTTADAHPMHLHLIAFQVVQREQFDPLTFVPAVNDIANNVFAQPSYTVIPGTAVAPDPQDAGWKDTVYTPPGFVTRVIARFDKIGEYVWHCHILSHEEHDMMRPMKVVPLVAVAPASVSVPATSTGLSVPVTIVDPLTQVANTGLKYVVEFKLAADANWTTNASTATNPTITFPAFGTYNVRAKIADPALSPTFADSPYVNANDIVVNPADSIVSPVNGAVLAGATQLFTLSSGATTHVLWLGTALGTSDLGRFTAAPGITAITATGLPTNSSAVFVRLWTKGTMVDAADPTRILTTWSFNDYTYTAANPALAITTTTLANGAVNAAYNQTVAATGGMAPYTWSATGLPAGLTMSATGVISGTPANVVPTGAFATFPVGITVQDSAAATATATLNLRINQTLPAAATGLNASAPVATQVVLTWTDNANNEAGVQIQRATNSAFTIGLTTVSRNGANLTTFTDTTVTPGTTYFYRVRSFNFIGNSAAFTNTATVTPAVPALVITTAALPNGAVNAAYSQTVAATGGTAPLTWSASGLPAGLTMSATGVISGTPANVVPTGAFATFSVTVTVRDSAVAPVTTSSVLSLRINQTLPAAPTALNAASTVANQVVLTWTDNANNDAGTRIERATNSTFSAGLSVVNKNGANLTTFTDSGVATGVTYFYRVKSFNFIGNSAAYSNVVTVTAL